MNNEKAPIPEVNVKSIHMDERGCDIQIQSESVLLLAEHFGKLLGDAPNFITMSVMHPEIGMIDVTLQKVLGKPQAQVLREMREQVAALTAEVDALKAEVARRSAPVTDAEWIKHSMPRSKGYGYLPQAPTVREILDTIFAARATTPQDVENRVGFPRDKTDEWEARQDVEKS